MTGAAHAPAAGVAGGLFGSVKLADKKVAAPVMPLSGGTALPLAAMAGKGSGWLQSLTCTVCCAAITESLS